jgi:hypothetical protein
MAMAPANLQDASNMAHKRSHHDAFERGALQSHSSTNIPVESPAKRKQKAQGAANTYTVQVQRVFVKKKKTTYLVRWALLLTDRIVVAEFKPGLV